MIAFSGLTHVIIGLVSYTYLFGVNVFALIFVIIGSLLPDIDIKYSILGKFNPFASIMKHRGRTHTIMCMIILSIPLLIYSKKIGIAFSFGYFTHILADGLTPMGIMWLYPYRKKYYSIYKW